MLLVFCRYSFSLSLPYDFVYFAPRLTYVAIRFFIFPFWGHDFQFSDRRLPPCMSVTFEDCKSIMDCNNKCSKRVTFSKQTSAAKRRWCFAGICIIELSATVIVNKTGGNKSGRRLPPRCGHDKRADSRSRTGIYASYPNLTTHNDREVKIYGQLYVAEGEHRTVNFHTNRSIFEFCATDILLWQVLSFP